MKKCYLILFLCLVLFLSSCSNTETSRYKEEYFSNKDSFIKISELIIQHYESNDLQGEMSIWCSKNEPTIFYGSLTNDASEPNISIPFEQSELDDIYRFIHDSRYEYVSISEEFIEFGNSTGSIFMYLCLTEKKPEKISKNHRMYDFEDGWYFSISITR